MDRSNGNRGHGQRADGRAIALAGLPDGAVEDGALRWSNGAGFRLPGGQRVYIVSLGPLHYRDADWQEYDLRFRPEAGNYAHQLRAADFDLRVAARPNAETLVRLERGGNYLCLSPQAIEMQQPVEGSDPQIDTVGSPGDTLGESIDQSDDQLTRTGRLHYPDAMGPGLNLELQPTERGLSKRVTLSGPPSLPGVISGDATLRLRWLCNTNLTARIAGQEFGGKPVIADGPVDLVDRDGRVIWHWPRPWAIDARGQRCLGRLALSPARGQLLVELLYPLAWFGQVVYPVVLDPDTYYGEDTDGEIYGDNADYATAHATADAIYAGVVLFDVGQTNDYYVMRAYVEFDTSGIAADQIVTRATLTLTANLDKSSTDFDILIYMFDWVSPLTAGNMEANYDGALAATAGSVIWRNTSGMALDTPYVSPVLATSWINPAGCTRYALLSSRDAAANQPPGGPGGNEYINIHSQTCAVAAHRPYLTIYTAPTAALGRGLRSEDLGFKPGALELL